MKRRICAGTLACLLPLTSLAQPGSYQYPIPNSPGLSGTFGENRTNHLHHGIDVRTFERTGLNVLAAQDGYITRVRVSHAGYGKSIYILHPDGNTTQYGHLERFYPALEAEIHRLQRESGQFEQEVFPQPGQFPVTKGQVIGVSGNTGGSQGPHLHYEVRDKLEAILNPQVWHPTQFPDDIPPYLVRIAFEPLGPESRVQGLPAKWLVPRLSQSGTAYTHPGIVKVHGPVGLEFAGYDKHPGSRPYLGVYGWEVYLDNQLLLDARMDRYTFDEVRQSLQLVDYQHQRRTSTKLQKAYRDAGLTLDIFRIAVNNGIIDLPDTAVHTVRLVLRDVAGNTCSFTTQVQREALTTRVNPTPAAFAPSADVRRGLLVLTSSLPPAASSTVTLTLRDCTRVQLPVEPIPGGKVVAVWGVSGAAPPIRAEASWWPSALALDYQLTVLPEGGQAWRTADAEVSFPAGSVFVTTPISLRSQTADRPLEVSARLRIGDPQFPIYRAYSLSLSPDSRAARFPVEKIVLCEVYGNNYVRVSGESQTNGRWTANTTSFGTFVLVADQAPPSIRAQNFRAGRLVTASYLKLTLNDAISGVHPFKIQVRLDGQWMPPEYYSYQRALFVYFDPRHNAGLNGQRLRPGKHILEVVATDYAGNQATQRFAFLTR